MAQVVVMPQLGNTVESCLITAWRVRLGDQVEPGTIVAEVETDKSTMEIPAGVSGKVLALLAREGDEVPVKTPFLIVGEVGESVDMLLEKIADSVPVGENQPKETPQPVETSQGAQTPQTPQTPQPPEIAPLPWSPQRSSRSILASPRARRAAERAGVDLAKVTGTGPGGRILAADLALAIAAVENQPTSGPPDPPAEILRPAGFTRGAKAQGGIAAGTGIGGRVARKDLQTHQPPRTPATPACAPTAPTAQESIPDFTETALTGIRKLVAERMHASLAAHAQMTLTTSAPAQSLLAARARFKASHHSQGTVDATIGDLVAYAAAQTVAHFPNLNATAQNMVMRSYSDVHLGVAVDTPRGLVVPTLRHASRMGFEQFCQELNQLIDQARTGKIDPDLLSGASFSVTNLGAFGIESFTPILNSPQVGILGVGAVRPCASLGENGHIGVEQRLSFSLTVDHGVVDGADAARFLQSLVSFVAEIDRAVTTEGGNNG